MIRRLLPWSAALLCLLALAGCPPTNNDPNDPNDGNDPNSSTQLTPAQQAAVNLLVEQLAAAGAVLGTLAPLTEEALDFDVIEQIGSFGECPAVVFVASATLAALEFSFGDGCSSPATGGETFSGAVQLQVTRATRVAGIVFSSFEHDGRAVDGTLTLEVTRRAGGGVELAGTCNLTTAQTDTFTGSLTAVIDAQGRITITTAEVELGDDDRTLDVTLAGIVFDPAGNGNFVPESGTATFALPNDGPGPDPITIVVEFSAQSPVDGTVQVAVGGGPETEHQVPGIGD